jgi:hypothetical protein
MSIKFKIIVNDHTCGKDFKLQLKIHNWVIKNIYIMKRQGETNG